MVHYDGGVVAIGGNGAVQFGPRPLGLAVDVDGAAVEHQDTLGVLLPNVLLTRSWVKLSCHNITLKQEMQEDNIPNDRLIGDIFSVALTVIKKP